MRVPKTKIYVNNHSMKPRQFGPKASQEAVETVELRSSLVYEIRVFVEDPQDEMRLGMPATVSLELSPLLGDNHKKGIM